MPVSHGLAMAVTGYSKIPLDDLINMHMKQGKFRKYWNNKVGTKNITHPFNNW
jgi:hypothetical protein